MIWLLRHGDAESEAEDDASRRLTERGRAQAAAAGRALSRLEIEVKTCLTSPKVRARETASIACETLGLEPEVANLLRGGDFDLAELVAGRGEVVLVGHEPDFTRAIQMATGARTRLRKGGIAAVDDGVLVHLLTPQQLALIGD